MLGLMRLPKNSKWIYAVAGVLAAACWGLATVMSKGALQYVPPLTLLVVQLIASNIFLWTVVAARHLSLPPSSKIFRLGLTGVLEPGITYTFALLGLEYTTASSATLISTTETIAIIFFAWLLLRERVSLPLLALAALAFIGVLLVVVHGDSTTSSSHSWFGNVMLFIGTLCAAIYVVLSRRIVINLNPLLLLALQQAFGLAWAIAIWPVGLLGGEAVALPVVGVGAWLWVAASGIIQYALAFWFYLIALKGVQASLASLFLTLIPVFGVTGAFLFLDEQLNAAQWIGAILILIALVGISRLQGKAE